MKKLFIIGAGPGGISSALYAKRANIDVSVIYGDNSSLINAHQIDNYYGVPSISGKELYDIGIKQAKDLDIPMYKEEVLSIEYENSFNIITKDNTYQADAIILANGAYRNTPNIKRIKDFEGQGVSYCAMCDGFFYRKKKIAVIGNGSYAYHEASYLSNLTNDLTVLTGANPINDERLHEFNLIEDKIDTVLGEDCVSGIRFENGNELEFDGIFIALGVAGSVDLAKKMGILISGNKIETDENCMTNIEGIFAVGDATKGMAQIAKAVYDGAVAANAVLVLFNRK